MDHKQAAMTSCGVWERQLNVEGVAQTTPLYAVGLQSLCVTFVNYLNVKSSRFPGSCRSLNILGSPMG